MLELFWKMSGKELRLQADTEKILFLSSQIFVQSKKHNPRELCHCLMWKHINKKVLLCDRCRNVMTPLRLSEEDLEEFQHIFKGRMQELTIRRRAWLSFTPDKMKKNQGELMRGMRGSAERGSFTTRGLRSRHRWRTQTLKSLHNAGSFTHQTRVMPSEQETRLIRSE